MMDSEHVWTPLLVTPTALIERRGSHLVWEAWTDVGSVGVGRTAVLTQIDNFRQGTAHPRVDPPGGRGAGRRATGGENFNVKKKLRA